MYAIDYVLLAAAALGHLAWAVSGVNRSHSLAIPRWSISVVSALYWSSLVLVPLLLAPHEGRTIIDLVREGNYLPLAYLVPCWIAMVLAIVERMQSSLAGSVQGAGIVEDRVTEFDLVEMLGHRPAGDRATELASRIPGNQIFRLHVHEKTLQIPRLAPQLNGVVIAHLSDLHMCGKISRAYFEEVVAIANGLKPELVAITGDLFDAAACLDWIPTTLGELRAPAGVYFVLGNHDRRIDFERARRELVAAGLVDLGGRCREISLRGTRLQLAGNELPWFAPAADVRDFAPQQGEQRHTRVLLSHSPDQIEWARRGDFDLMLAGHTHGGQIRFPLLGAVMSPSRHGARYAAGTFYLAPTVLHVSRGVSGLTPLRLNCPPELSLLRLRTSAVVSEEPQAELTAVVQPSAAT